jgi:hypothetical protein
LPLTGELAMKTKALWDDPVVREVREARAKLWKEAGGTFEGLQRLVAERVAKLTKMRPKRRTTRRPERVSG